MDVSTHSTAENHEGVVDAPVAPETRIVPGWHKEDVVEPLIEPTNEVPMQFVRLGLPAAIFLWFVVGLVAYGAYRFFAG
jgi:hypothetical protein